MRPKALFPSILGPAFARLDPQLQWVHGGEGRELSGTVTVERGGSFVSKVLAAASSLPPALANAPITVRIDVTADGERWTRTYARDHDMFSTLYRDEESLVERLGPSALTFRVLERDAGMDWQLERVSMLGLPLPVSWFQVSARVDMVRGRYHFLIDSSLRGFGRIVRYEGFLDVSH